MLQLSLALGGYQQTDPLRHWRGLDLLFTRDERLVFVASTRMVVGDGTPTLFWEDCWLDNSYILDMSPDLLMTVSGVLGIAGPSARP